MQITRSYHKITERLHAAASEEERVKAEAELKAMGGAVAYQQATSQPVRQLSSDCPEAPAASWLAPNAVHEVNRKTPTPSSLLPQASQLNTALHSTSRWCLRRIEFHHLHSDPRSQRPPAVLEARRFRSSLFLGRRVHKAPCPMQTGALMFLWSLRSNSKSECVAPP